MKYITNEKALDKVGATIKLEDMAADDVNKVVSYLRPAAMSSDAVSLQQELMNNTRELAGAGDNLNGNVDPTQASGKAILAVQQAGREPLNDQLEKFKTFIEDLARIWFDMLQTYSTNGIIVTKEVQDQKTGETTEVTATMSHEELQDIKLNIKIEITRHSAYDEYALEQSLENLMMQQLITFEEYVEALPENSVMPKHTLQNTLKKRQEKQAKIDQMQIQAQQMQSALEQQMRQQENTDRAIADIENQANVAQEEVLAQIGGM